MKFLRGLRHPDACVGLAIAKRDLHSFSHWRPCAKLTSVIGVITESSAMCTGTACDPTSVNAATSLLSRSSAGISHLANETDTASQESCVTSRNDNGLQGNLPGWRWKRIKQLFLVGSSSSLHSEVCNALGGVSASPTAKFLSSDMCVRALSTSSAPRQGKSNHPRVATFVQRNSRFPHAAEWKLRDALSQHSFQ